MNESKPAPRKKIRPVWTCASIPLPGVTQTLLGHPIIGWLFTLGAILAIWQLSWLGIAAAWTGHFISALVVINEYYRDECEHK